jgi:hypothetical protein
MNLPEFPSAALASIDDTTASPYYYLAEVDGTLHQRP